MVARARACPATARRGGPGEVDETRRPTGPSRSGFPTPLWNEPSPASGRTWCTSPRRSPWVPSGFAPPVVSACPPWRSTRPTSAASPASTASPPTRPSTGGSEGSTGGRRGRWCHRHLLRPARGARGPRPSPVAARRLAGPVRPDRRSRGVHDHWTCRHPDRVVVEYAGLRLAAEKQVRRLTEIASIPGIRLVVVGDGPPGAGWRRGCRRRSSPACCGAPTSHARSPSSTCSSTPARRRRSARRCRRRRPAASQWSHRPQAVRSISSTTDARACSSTPPTDGHCAARCPAWSTTRPCAVLSTAALGAVTGRLGERRRRAVEVHYAAVTPFLRPAAAA